MKSQFIKDLEPGTVVNDIFYVDLKREKDSKTGEKYVVFTLKDRTGTILAYLWENLAKSKDIKKGMFVWVKGTVDEYDGRIRIVLSEIERYLEKPAPEDFLSSTKHDVEEMFKELKSYMEKVKNPYLKKLLTDIFDDEEIRERFKKAPSGVKAHHAYLGGLLEHTLSLLRLAQGFKEKYPEIDEELLITGIILHDIGKIEEYEYEKVIEYSVKGRLLGHIVLGYELVREKIKNISGFPEDLAYLVYHMILSHHGEYEFGSPTVPLILEAEILHHLDNLDAKVSMFREAGERTKEKESVWSDYHPLLKRKIFIRRDEE